MNCQAENYVKVGGQQVGELERCAAPGQLVVLEGQLLGAEVTLCKRHRQYFEHAGYRIRFVREKKRERVTA